MRGIVVDVRRKTVKLVEDDTPLPKTTYVEPEPIDLMQLKRDVEALKSELQKIRKAIGDLHPEYTLA